MRYEGIHITALGVELGQEVRTSWMARRGALAVADARRTRQRSVCVAGAPGPELAVRTGRVVLRRDELETGLPAPIGVHLHASTYDKPDYWSAACFVLDQRSLAECAMALDVNAMSNSMALGVDMAAGLLCGRPDLEAALITAGDRFDGPRFGGRHGRYRTDFGVLYGDAGVGMVVSRTPGVAELVSAVTRTYSYLEGLTRGTTASTEDLMAGSTVDPRARTGAWVRTHSGLEEAFRRSSAGVIETVKAALVDAGIELDQARRIIVPFLGHEAVVSQWLRPLGISEDRTLTLLGMHMGHLGAADHIVGLHHLLVTNALSPGDYVVLASADAGDELDHDCLAHG
jgi:3-oxoacyl-[acyl-carrier-protein] synthase-3